jgi:hypothetical protein
MRWLIDAMNLIGSTPDGWWRDREGAMRKLVAEARAWAATQDDPVTVVLDTGPDDLLGTVGPLTVVRATRRGPTTRSCAWSKRTPTRSSSPPTPSWRLACARWAQRWWAPARSGRG